MGRRLSSMVGRATAQFQQEIGRTQVRQEKGDQG
jgi:hypothetical protein